MSNEINKLMYSDEEIKNAIIKDFATDFFNEVQKLVDEHGKEGLMKLIQEREERQSA